MYLALMMRFMPSEDLHHRSKGPTAVFDGFRNHVHIFVVEHLDRFQQMAP
jgi:hypothetical protein